MRTKHEGTKYYCDECDYNATTKNNVRIHRESKHLGKIYYCTECSYSSNCEESVNKHRRAKHLGIFHNCIHCDYKSLWQDNVRRHVKNMHIGAIQLKEMRVNRGVSSNKFILKCQLCNFTSKSEKDLVIHKKNSHEGVQYICEDCDQQARIEHKVKSGFLSNKLKCENCERQPVYAYLPDGYKQRICKK